jgi:hypothetical protein
MKGPRSRHRFNVLRLWECPQCKKRAFAPPQVVSRACVCQGPDRPTWMCLLEAPPRRPASPPPAESASEGTKVTVAPASGPDITSDRVSE